MQTLVGVSQNPRSQLSRFWPSLLITDQSQILVTFQELNFNMLPDFWKANPSSCHRASPFTIIIWLMIILHTWGIYLLHVCHMKHTLYRLPHYKKNSEHLQKQQPTFHFLIYIYVFLCLSVQFLCLSRTFENHFISLQYNIQFEKWGDNSKAKPKILFLIGKTCL